MFFPEKIFGIELQISSLTGHCARIIGTASKAAEPPDRMVNAYLRSKKYIGSSERRFISGTVFNFFRISKLAEYCTKEAMNSFNIREEDLQLNDPHRKNPYKSIDFLNVCSSLIIASDYPGAELFPAKKMISAFSNKEQDILSHLSEAISANITIPDVSSKTILNEISDIFEKINNKANISCKSGSSDRDAKKYLSTRYAFPEWILDSLLNWNFGIKEVCGLADSFLRSAPVVLRINSASISRQEVLERLKQMDIDSSPSPISPHGIILGKRINLYELDLFKSGLVEIQDDGSQIISFALSPETGESVLDACAGAGGKSLHIAAIQSDSGEIYSADVDPRKLFELRKRAKRAGICSVQTFHWNKVLKGKRNDRISTRLRAGFDTVLIDAPCSGTGTARRMPWQLERLTPRKLEKHSAMQLRLLKEYSAYAKPGGIVVYATCSIMPEENEKLIRSFLESNPDFETAPLRNVFIQHDIEFDELEGTSFELRLSPHKHGCDGFYMARLRRKNV